jgi:hypothetical protein
VTLQARLIAALASLLGLAVLIGAALLKGYHMGASASDAKHLAEQSAARDAQDKTAQIIAARLADMASTQAKTVERVIHETTTNHVYADCVVPDSGLRLLNDAISGKPTEPASGDGVQAPATAP